MDSAGAEISARQAASEDLDRKYLEHALDLAARGAGMVSPNPLVGSVVVRDGRVVGSGYHRYDELKHAEVWALEEAGELAQGSYVYVNLEPCSHQGEGKRTPPCVRALIEARVRRVVASMFDPNPRVNGRGFEELRTAGIEVVTGVMEAEALRLNEKYAKYVTTGLPFVHLKAASTLDGRIATASGESKWITGEAAREASQRLRHEYDAILIGVGTALADDPLLTDRTGLPRRRPLTRIVLDSSLRLSPQSNLARSARELPLIVFCSASTGADPDKRRALERAGAEVVEVDSAQGQLDLGAVLRHIGGRHLTSLIVEGGAEVAGSFVGRNLVDKFTFFLAPKIIGGRASYPSIAGDGAARLSDAVQLENVEIARHGDDIELTGYPKRAGAE